MDRLGRHIDIAGRVLAVVAVLAALALIIWADAYMSAGLVLFGAAVTLAQERPGRGALDIECAACDARFTGPEEQARAEGWSFVTCVDSEPRWLCRGCRAEDEESPDGFPNPGAGFCGGLGDEARRPDGVEPVAPRAPSEHDAVRALAREARARADRATPGPWDHSCVLPRGMLEVAEVGTYFIRSAAGDDRLPGDAFDTDAFRSRAPANANFISAARTDVPALCEAVEVGRAQIEGLDQANREAHQAIAKRNAEIERLTAERDEARAAAERIRPVVEAYRELLPLAQDVLMELKDWEVESGDGSSDAVVALEGWLDGGGQMVPIDALPPAGESPS